MRAMGKPSDDALSAQAEAGEGARGRGWVEQLATATSRFGSDAEV